MVCFQRSHPTIKTREYILCGGYVLYLRAMLHTIKCFLALKCIKNFLILENTSEYNLNKIQNCLIRSYCPYINLVISISKIARLRKLKDLFIIMSWRLFPKLLQELFVNAYLSTSIYLISCVLTHCALYLYTITYRQPC